MVCHCSVLDGFSHLGTGTLQPATPPHPAKVMTPPQRRQLALEALAGTETVSRLAGQHAVSRKFVYRQTTKAEEALDAAFSPADRDDETVLFHLPVTKAWLRQLILGLTLNRGCEDGYVGSRAGVLPSDVHSQSRRLRIVGRPTSSVTIWFCVAREAKTSTETGHGGTVGDAEQGRASPLLGVSAYSVAASDWLGYLRTALMQRRDSSSVAAHSGLWSLGSSYLEDTGRNICLHGDWKRYEKTARNQSLTVCETDWISIFHAPILSAPVR